MSLKHDKESLWECFRLKEVSQSFWVAVTKIPETGYLKQRIFISHSSGGQGASRFGIWPELTSWFIDDCRLIVSSHVFQALHQTIY